MSHSLASSALRLANHPPILSEMCHPIAMYLGSEGAIAPETYLDHARIAGALCVCEGFKFVAGVLLESVLEQPTIYIEYASRHILQSSRRLRRMEQLCRAKFPSIDRMVLRSNGLPPVSRWTRTVTSVISSDLIVEQAVSREIILRADRSSERSLVCGWLEEALCAAHPFANAGQIGAVAEMIYSHERRHTCVAEIAGQTVGHATVLIDQFDPVSGRPYIEFLDALVAQGVNDLRKDVTAGLINYFLRYSRRCAVPLWGHVVFDQTSQGCRPPELVLLALKDSGWLEDYSLYELL